jgi:hypothetical protein
MFRSIYFSFQLVILFAAIVPAVCGLKGLTTKELEESHPDPSAKNKLGARIYGFE